MYCKLVNQKLLQWSSSLSESAVYWIRKFWSGLMMERMRKSSTSVRCVCSCWTLVNDYVSIHQQILKQFWIQKLETLDEVYVIGTASACSMLAICDLGHNKRNVNRLVVFMPSQAANIPRQSVWIKWWQSLLSQFSQAHRKIEPAMENEHSFTNLLHVTGFVNVIHV